MASCFTANDLKPPEKIVSLINSKKCQEYKKDKTNLNENYQVISKQLQETFKQKLDVITAT